MNTKGKAEEKIALCGLQHDVTVEDCEGEQGEPRRRFYFQNANGKGESCVELDADPSPEQIDNLALNLAHGDAVDYAHYAAVLKAP